MPKCIESNCINEGKIKIKTLDGQVLYVCERHVNLWLESGCSLVKPFRKRAVDKLKFQGRIIKKIITSPVNFFREVKDENLGTSYAFYAKLLVIFAILFTAVLVVIIWRMISMIFGLFTSVLTLFGIPAEAVSINIQGWFGLGLEIMAVVMLISIIIGGLIGILVGSGWMHIWVYLCGGRKGIKQTIKAMAYGSTPWLLLGWIPYVGIIGGIWCIITSIIGIKQLHEISTPKAILAYLLGAIIIPLIIPLIIIFLV